MPELAPVRARVRFKVVARQPAKTPRPAILQKCFQTRPVDGPWMIVIDFGALARIQVRAVEVKIVHAKANGLFAKHLLQAVGQPALARAAPADNRHQAWCGHGSHAWPLSSCASES